MGLKRLRAWYSVILLLILWEGVTRAGLVKPLFLPSLTASVKALLTMAARGDLAVGAYYTVGRATVGFLIALAAGVIVGLTMGRSRHVERFFNPLIGVGYPTPKIALFPVFIFWLGIGHLPNILIIAVSCFFPIAINSYYGVKGIDRELVWSARSMGLKERDILFRVVLPAVMPNVFNGVRIAIPVAFVLALATEMVMGRTGLGHMVILAERKFESQGVFAGIMAIGILGLVINKIVALLQVKLLTWHEKLREA